MKQNYTEQQYVQMAIKQLCETLEEIPFISDVEIKLTGLQRGFGDFWATVHFVNDKESVTLCVEVSARGESRFAHIFALEAAQHKDDRCYIFTAPYISEQTAAYLKSEKRSFMDLSGNCYIAADPIFISVEGKPNQFVSYEHDRNYFSRKSTAASVIMRTMLHEHKKTWQVKELANASGKSLGAVSNVKKYLVEHGWAETQERGIQLCNIEELLRTWAKEYHKRDDRTVKCYSLDSIPVLEKNIQRWNEQHGGTAVLGTFSAAARYAPVVRYNKLNIYVEQQDVDELMKDLELKEVPSGENVTIIIPHDESPCLYAERVNGNMVTSPVQTILDLLSGAGRGEEAAAAIIAKEYSDHDR